MHLTKQQLTEFIKEGLQKALQEQKTDGGMYKCTKAGHPDYLVNGGTNACTWKKRGFNCKLEYSMGEEAPKKLKCPRHKKPEKDESKPSTKRTKRTRSTRKSTRTSKKRRTPKYISRCDPTLFIPLILKAAKKYNIPADLVMAVIRVESDFCPHAVSSAGAEGLMQLMPGTAKELGVKDPFDPEENIMNGTKYLRKLANQFEGDARLVLAAYNAGPGAVQGCLDDEACKTKKRGIPYAQTERYVRKVLVHYYRFQDSEPNR